ncbi:MAG: helix-turn-helix domain-containing protein [Sporichthyaceae bacterium]
MSTTRGVRSANDGHAVGPLLREWRARRRLSQMDLALSVGVSTRHLSFVETGRSRPSPELVLALAEGLEVPLRERNALLLAAGYAPRFPARPLQDAALAPALAAVRRLLDAHDPYPGIAVDRSWDIVLATAAASVFIEAVGPAALAPRPNAYRLALHPAGLAAQIANFPTWAAHLLEQLDRAIAATADPDLRALAAEVRAYPNVAALAPAPKHEADPLLLPMRFVLDGAELSLFSTITTFGTAVDVTLAELSIELFYPADDATARMLAGRGSIESTLN